MAHARLVRPGWMQAGNAAAQRCRLRPAVPVLKVEPDEPHVEAAKQLVRSARQLIPALPWRGPLLGPWV
eukprot:353532-Chlamydomonas_euryale.AAC.6